MLQFREYLCSSAANRNRLACASCSTRKTERLSFDFPGSATERLVNHFNGTLPESVSLSARVADSRWQQVCRCIFQIFYKTDRHVSAFTHRNFKVYYLPVNTIEVLAYVRLMRWDAVSLYNIIHRNCNYIPLAWGRSRFINVAHMIACVKVCAWHPFRLDSRKPVAKHLVCWTMMIIIFINGAFVLR